LRNRFPIEYNAGMKSSCVLAAMLAVLSAPSLASAGPGTPCSDEWNRYVDREVVTGDGQGHGPDLGSEEWKGVVEFKLGIRGQADLPARDSDDWCQFIDRLLAER
jgi:hypothetical protein